MNKVELEKKIKLSIGILVSNQKEYIRKAMEALKPLLDAVPSELIVLDTKGEAGDGSIEIVREYTDKVYPFTWCNDFAKARNACLSYASGEWFMYQDDDEWFEDVQEFIDFFNSGECEKYNSGCYYTRSYNADGGYTTGVASRMIRRGKDTCFVGRIHESFNAFPAPTKYFNSFVHHMGYAYITQEMQQQKHERNMALLKEELKQEGYTFRVCVQMVQELMNSPETVKESLKFAETALNEFAKAGNLGDSCAQWVMTATVRCYDILKDYKGMLRQVKNIQETYSVSEVTQLVIAAVVARSAFLKRDYPIALEYADEYLKHWNWIDNHKEKALTLMQLDFPSYYEEEYYISMLYAGAFSANRLGSFQRAMKFWNLFPWKKEGFDAKKYWAEMLVTKNGLQKTKEPSRELIKSDIKLTIGILVSNRIKYIRKAMEGLKPLLEAIPCELIAVDTKGEDGDGSIDVVKEYTDKIYPFTWCNDFAAARNVCMEHARGEWFMYQDDDEWFDDVQEIIDFFISGECENYRSANYYVKNYDIMGNTDLAFVGRMIRRAENTCFVGKVHECFNEVYAPCKQFRCFVHHMGYVFYTEEDEKIHQNRNVSLLREELDRNGYTPRLCAQMVQELLTSDSTAKEGLEFALKCVERFKKDNLLEDACSQWILVAIIRYYVLYETYLQAAEHAEKIRNTYPLSQTAEMVLSALLIAEAKENRNEKAILENVKIYIRNWDWIQAHAEEAILQNCLDFPKYTTKECYYSVLYEGAVAENRRGNFKEAMTYWNRMPWKEEGFDGSSYFAAFQETHEGYKALLEQAQKEQTGVQKEVKELIAILFETKPLISQYIEEEHYQEKVELLTGMQELVITLGNKLEALLGENTPQIHVLEHCCELLWQCANEKDREQARTIAEEFFENIKNMEL